MALLFIPAAISMALHLLYLYENAWGAGLVSAYTESDAHYYYYKAWYSAVISHDGGWLASVIPFSPYIALLTATFNAFWPEPGVAFILNAVFIALTCTFIAALTEKLFGYRSGMIAGLLAAFCGVFIFYAGLTVKTSFVLLLTSFAMHQAVLAIQKQSYVNLAVSALALIIAAYDRDNLVILLVPLLVLFSRTLGDQNAWRRYALPALAVIAIWCTVKLLTLTIWGSSGIGNLIGVNFYVGNAPGALGNYTKIHGFENNLVGLRLGVLNHLKDIYGTEPSFWQKHSFLLGQWADYYLERPGEYLLLKVKHAMLMLSQYSYGHPELYPAWRGQFIATSIALVDWRVIAALAISYVIVGRDELRRRDILCLLTFGVLYAVTVWIFLVTERYRLPLYLMAIPFSARALELIIAGRRYKVAMLALVLAAASTSLNQLLIEGPGWSNSFEKLRSMETARRQDSSEIYGLMSSIHREPSAENLTRLAYHLLSTGNCSDAAALAKRAEALGADPRSRTIMSKCQAQLVKKTKSDEK